MSRILQALKQLEARPAGEAEAEGSLPLPAPTAPGAPAEVENAAAADSPSPPAAPSRMPTTPLRRALEKQLSAEPPSLAPIPPATESPPSESPPAPARTTPRRKRRQVRRAKQEAAPIERLDEIEAMLGTLGPGVIECWAPDRASSEAIVTDTPADSAAVTPTVLIQEQLPEVVRVVESAPPSVTIEPEAPPPAKSAESVAGQSEAATDHDEALTALLASLVPSVVQCWSPEMAAASAVVVETPPPEADAGGTVVVREQLPEVVHVEVEVAPPPPEPTANSDANASVTAPLVHGEDLPVSEVELRFQGSPRRAERRPKVAPVKRRERKRQVATAREQEMRTLVRGPKSPATVPSSPWETTIQADLEDPRVVGGLRRLVESWQQQHAEHETTTLLAASLGGPLLAAEVVMRGGALLAEATECAVLVIDADEDAGMSRRLGIAGKPGLAELLAPDDAHGETIFPTATPRVHILPRGRGALPAQADAGAVRRLLRELSAEYAYVLVAGGTIAGPTISAFARGALGTYVVVPAGQINIETARQGLGLLQAAGARVLGSVVVGG